MPVSFSEVVGASGSGQPSLGGKIFFGALLSLTFGGIFAGLGGWAAWHIVETVTFWDSRAPFVPKPYPILSWGPSKFGCAVRIDPYKTGSTFINVSKGDLRFVRENNDSYHGVPLCYPALEQRQSGAIRMHRPDEPRPSNPQVPVIVPCPEDTH